MFYCAQNLHIAEQDFVVNKLAINNDMTQSLIITIEDHDIINPVSGIKVNTKKFRYLLRTTY